MWLMNEHPWHCFDCFGRTSQSKGCESTGYARQLASVQMPALPLGLRWGLKRPQQPAAALTLGSASVLRARSLAEIHNLAVWAPRLPRLLWLLWLHWLRHAAEMLAKHCSAEIMRSVQAMFDLIVFNSIIIATTLLHLLSFASLLLHTATAALPSSFASRSLGSSWVASAILRGASRKSQSGFSRGLLAGGGAWGIGCAFFAHLMHTLAGCPEEKKRLRLVARGSLLI